MEQNQVLNALRKATVEYQKARLEMMYSDRNSYIYEIESKRKKIIEICFILADIALIDTISNVNI